MVEDYSGCKPDLTLEQIMSRPETHYDQRHIKHLIIGDIQVGERKAVHLKKDLTLKDRIHTIKVRSGFNRMSYAFPPGLYLIGERKDDLPVLVSCNYKLTLDVLRKEITLENYWLLILDTKGVNVWCAAGKGTFGTEELIFQLTKWDIKKQLGTRKIILPQLGASRMEPHVVRKLTGMTVIYGPITAADVGAFIDAGLVASPESRQVTFTLKERLVLTPIEFVAQLKKLIPILLVMLVLGFSWLSWFPLLIMAFVGTVLFPLCLPYLPFKAFSVKGMLLAIPFVASSFYLFWDLDPLQMLTIGILCLIYVGYLALNFTGSTTYTSLSGVEYEVALFKKYGKPIGVIAAVVLTIHFLLGRF